MKLGPLGATACLNAGANDLGGTLMNETITRSAGASHGQEFNPKQMDDLINLREESQNKEQLCMEMFLSLSGENHMRLLR